MRRGDRQVPHRDDQGVAQVGADMDDMLRQMAETHRAMCSPARLLRRRHLAGPTRRIPAGRGVEARTASQQAFGSGFLRGGLVSHWRGKRSPPRTATSPWRPPCPLLPHDTYVVWTGLPLYPAEPGPLPGQGNVPETSARSADVSQVAWISAGRLDDRLALRLARRTPTYRFSSGTWNSIGVPCAGWPRRSPN